MLFVQLAGGVILAFGIIALVDPTLITNMFSMIPGYQNLQYYINITQALLNNAILLTCIGSVVVVLSLLGCFAPCIGNKTTILASISFRSAPNFTRSPFSC